MRFFFNQRKAAQAAAYLVKLHGGQINLMALLKLLYLADRAVLVETGYTITGDHMVSMPHGPVLSCIYDSAKWGKMEDDPWYEYMSETTNYEVSLVCTIPELDELSEYEIDILTNIHDEYGKLDQWELRALTHRLPEWQDPLGSSLPIDPVSILRFEGKSDAEIQALAHIAEEVLFLEELKSESLGHV